MEQITFNMLRTTAKNPNTQQDAEGYTVLVDGQLKDLFDKMIKLDKNNYPDYGNIIAKCLSRGISAAVDDLNKR